MTDRPPSPSTTLDYQTPTPRRPTEGMAKIPLFGIGVCFAAVMVFTFDYRFEPPTAFELSLVVAAVSMGLFVLVDFIRRRLSKRALSERSAWFALLTGICCVGAPGVVRIALVGTVPTLPWTVTTWVVAVVAAPFIVYPPVQAE